MSEAFWDLLMRSSEETTPGQRAAAQKIVDGFIESVMLPIIRRRLPGWLKARVSAEDISQEAVVNLLDVLSKKREFREIKGRLRITLRLIARRCSIDERRKQEARKRGGTITVSHTDLSAIVDSTTLRLSQELSLAIKSALAKLSCQDREILIDRACHDKAFVDIGRELGVHCSTVRSRYQKAKQILAEELCLDA